MSTVRRRTIELAHDPATYDEAAPIETFEEAGRAKLEADAYLGLIINQLVDGMVQAEELQTQVVDEVPERIIQSKPQYHGKPNSMIAVGTAAHAFKNAFLDAYSYNYTPLKEVMAGTVVGRKAVVACRGYVDAADVKLGALASYFKDHTTYQEPTMLLHNGFSTFSDMTVDAITAINATELSVEERAVHLAGAERSLLGIASLSLQQAQTQMVGAPVIEGGKLNLSPNVQSARNSKPNSRQAEVRPHHGCPAMPSMPEANNLTAGSPLARMWRMTSKLIVAANVHAMDSDAPEHAIFPQAAARQAA